LAWPYLVLVVLYCSLIVWLSGQSDPPVPTDVFPHWDKLQHIAAFALLDLLVLLGMLRSRIRYGLAPLLIAPALAAILFGLSDELHQSFVPGREVDPLDIVSDTAGALLAQGVFLMSVYRPSLRRWWPPNLPWPERAHEH